MKISDTAERALGAINFGWQMTGPEDRAAREELIPGGYVDAHGTWRLTPKGVTALRDAVKKGQHSWIKTHMQEAPRRKPASVPHIEHHKNPPKFKRGDHVEGVAPSIYGGIIEGIQAGDWTGHWDPKIGYTIPWIYSVRDDRGVLHSYPEESLREERGGVREAGPRKQKWQWQFIGYFAHTDMPHDFFVAPGQRETDVAVSSFARFLDVDNVQFWPGNEPGMYRAQWFDRFSDTYKEASVRISRAARYDEREPAGMREAPTATGGWFFVHLWNWERPEQGWTATLFNRRGAVVNSINGDSEDEVRASAKKHWPNAVEKRLVEKRRSR
jgi:hypothetical protein